MKLIKRYESTMYGNYKKEMLRYGALLCLGLVMLVLLRFAMMMPINLPLPYISSLTILGLMFVFTYLYRKDIPSHKLTFKEAYLLNLGTGIIGGILYAFFIWLYATYIDKDFTSNFMGKHIHIYAESEAKMDELRMMASPKYLAVRTFAEVSLLSVFFGLIVSIFMRTEKSTIREKK